MSTPHTAPLLVELFVEELPPKALKTLGEAFATGLTSELRSFGLTDDASVTTAFASPRRLAVHVSGARSVSPASSKTTKLMPVTVALDDAGQPTPALLKKLATLGVDVADPAAALARTRAEGEGKGAALFLDSVLPGTPLPDGLQFALKDTIAKLPIPKLMQYQLHGAGVAQPGWTSVHFVRPAHGLLALHGDAVVPVSVLGLTAGRSTRGHRFEAAQPVLQIAHADAYADTLRTQGAVLPGFAERRAEIRRQLDAAGTALGLKPIEDDALLDEVTALVERPNVLVCQFEEDFLAVPPECLILTMKANQKYFPLLDAAGRLSHRFLVVSNIRPVDPVHVVGGNERVVRPRLADAKFFFDQDRKRPLASRVAELAQVTYHAKLGTQRERVRRVQAIARAVALAWQGDVLAAQCERAAELAKADLLTDMVREFPELQGAMGGYYARHDGETEAVALAIEDHYRPRFAGDALPRGDAGVVLALADKLETLAGMFGIGQLPTGDKDPFALRRHALGVMRMLIERDLPLAVPALVAMAFRAFPDGHGQAQAEVQHFLFERLVGALREQGWSAQEVDAVVALRPERWGEIPRRLAAVRAFAALPEAPALAAANKRVGNILKKSDAAPGAQVQAALLRETAEQALAAALAGVAPRAEALFAAGDMTASLQALAALKAPVDAFFDAVMVNAEDPALRGNRLTLLAQLHAAMNRVADLSRLAA